MQTVMAARQKVTSPTAQDAFKRWFDASPIYSGSDVANRLSWQVFRTIAKRGAIALRRLIAGLCLIVLYCWAMTMAVLPLLRYMLPAIGVLFVALPGAWFSLRGRVAHHPALALGRPS